MLSSPQFSSPHVPALHARAGRPLRIAVLAPPWISIPPPGYGGIELVVSQLCGGLVDRGHDVTLFAAPGSTSRARVQTVLSECHPDEIERALYESDHVARVFAAVDAAAVAGTPYDVLHDHCGFTALAMADRLRTPVVHTLHGAFTPQTGAFYRHHGAKAELVGISEAQRASAPAGVRVGAVVPNAVDTVEWPFQPVKDDYLLWVGRMHPTKGADRAIAAARKAGVPIVLAGPVQPGQEEFFRTAVEPCIDGVSVRYVGEVGGAVKQRLFAGARALLMPIRWNEPFGMVMVEALACGTPVISFPEGAAVEIVKDGVTGFLVDDVAAMAAAVGRLGDIDPGACRADVVERFDVGAVAERYEAVYRRVARLPRLTSVRQPALAPAESGATGFATSPF